MPPLKGEGDRRQAVERCAPRRQRCALQLLEWVVQPFGDAPFQGSLFYARKNSRISPNFNCSLVFPLTLADYTKHRRKQKTKTNPKKRGIYALSIFAASAVLALTLAGCGGGNASTDTSAPADNSGSEASTTAVVSGTVSTNGSTSMEKVIGSLKEQFQKDNDGQVTVSYDATGSGAGIEAVTNGTTDIGLSSRALKDEETSAGLTGTTVALDGIAVIVNADSQVSDLSVEQIGQIFSGQITNWKDVGGADAEIACIGREANSGTRDGFESITDTKDKCKLSQELTSTGAVIEAVKNSPNAIGYASLSAVEGKDGIKSLTVGGVACTEETVLDGTYQIQRPFVLVTKNDTPLSEAAQAFFDYATSPAANDLIRSAGAVPVAK